METQKLTQKTIKNALFQGATNFLSKIGGFIFSILVARVLFPEEFGLYTLALSIILIFSSFSDFGIGTSITKYLSESIFQKNKTKSKNEARSIFFFLIKIKFLLSFLTSIVLFLFSYQISIFLGISEINILLKIGGLYLFVNSLFTIIHPIFLSIQKIKYSLIIEAVLQIMKILIVLILLYFYQNVFFVFLSLILSTTLVLFLFLVILIKKYSFLIIGKRAQINKIRILKFSMFLGLSSISTAILTNIDKVILGYYLSTEFLGYYSAISILVGGILGVISVSSVVFPAFTYLKGDRLKRAFNKTFHWLVIFSFPASFGLAYIILPLLQIFYGVNYVPGVYAPSLVFVSILFSFTMIESVLTATYANLFNAKEKPKIPALILVLSSILNLVLSIVLISFFMGIKLEYGMVGASIAVFLSHYIRLFSFVFFGNKRFNLQLDKNTILKPIIASLIMLIFLFIFDYFVILNILTGGIMIFLAAIIYFLSLFLIGGITKESITQFFNIIKNSMKAKPILIN